MRFFNGVPVLVCAAAILLAAACDDNGGGDGGSGGESLPGLLPFIWISTGGGGGTTVDGGNGGSIQFLPDSDILLDDGRARPVIGTNFLTASIMADNVVTYAELVTIQTPTISPPTSPVILASFSLPVGTGLELPAGVTLDLSDTPPSIERVAIGAQSEIAVYGPIFLTRTGANAIDLNLSTNVSGVLSIVIEGSIDGRGAPTFDGANVNVTSGTALGSGGPVALLSPSVNLSGGAGDAANAGGNGGNLLVQTGDDLLIPHGSFDTRGGDGTDEGGDGGLVRVEIETNTVAGALLADMRWGANTSGGAGGTSNGGFGGNFTFRWGAGNVDVSSRVIASGGDSPVGGGVAGATSILCFFNGALSGTITGTAYVTANGGSSTGGSGARAGNATVSAGTATDFLLHVELMGGTGQVFGGVGRTGHLEVNNATNCTVAGDTSGGAGVSGGGNAGGFLIGSTFAGVTSSMTGCRIDGVSRGGASTGGTGGAGGTALLGNYYLFGSPVAFTATSCSVQLEAPGGDGSVGGVGGGIVAGHHQGTMEFTLSGNLNGGAGIGTGAGVNGGAGGSVRFATTSGTATVGIVNVTADGGDGASTSGTGGAAGFLDFSGSAAGITITALNVSLDGGGGAGTGVGGVGGSADVNASGPVSFSGAFTSNGGAGATDGNGGDFVVVTPGSVTVDGTISTVGGGTAGSGGSIDIGNNQAATITVTGTSVLGANAAAPSGTEGSITLDAVGVGSSNPNLDVQAGAVLETLDGTGTNVTNVTLD